MDRMQTELSSFIVKGKGNRQGAVGNLVSRKLFFYKVQDNTVCLHIEGSDTKGREKAIMQERKQKVAGAMFSGMYAYYIFAFFDRDGAMGVDVLHL